MGYQDRDWYNDWRKQQERGGSSDDPPSNPYRDALRRRHASRKPSNKPNYWHGPSITLGAFLAFLVILVLNGFRFWFR
ncbi:MAG: hypothetical protein ACOVS5_08010 [Oligoflexus sp.]